MLVTEERIQLVAEKDDDESVTCGSESDANLSRF